MNKEYIVGVDVGGTFIDVFCYDTEQNVVLIKKIPSLRGVEWSGILSALQDLGVHSNTIGWIGHGTTIATNALLQRKGARVGVITTSGFKDVTEIGLTRRLKGGLFDMDFSRSAPLVERNLRCEIDERIDHAGDVALAVKTEQLDSIVEHFRENEVEAIAICLLNSYKNVTHEIALADAEAIRALAIPVSCSSELLPERGEFGRFSTCVLNAYLTPIMTKYLTGMLASLHSRSVSAPVDIMTSNGGSVSIDWATKRVISTFLSGPAAGVVGAMQIAMNCGIKDLITFDMGGTSADVALIKDLKPHISHDNQIDSYPLLWPQVDIYTIGAGGGSIVKRLADGSLDVGPESAGAEPGPACYGRGGTQPTVSDANVLLGRLSTSHALSGGLTLSFSEAMQAFESVAESKAEEPESAYDSANVALQIAVLKMAAAVREVSVFKGFDPRDFTLCGFGGAGPMHVLLVAQELGIEQVLIPPLPGYLCAFGLMFADWRRDYVEPWHETLSTASFGRFTELAMDLESRGVSDLRAHGFDENSGSVTFSADVRYYGQSFTIPIDFRLDQELGALIGAFHQRHFETYGFNAEDQAIQVDAIRLVAFGTRAKPRIQFNRVGGAPDTVGTQKVMFNNQWMKANVYVREALPHGGKLLGPALVLESGSTLVVPPHWELTVDTSDSILCRYISS